MAGAFFHFQNQPFMKNENREFKIRAALALLVGIACAVQGWYFGGWVLERLKQESTFVTVRDVIEYKTGFCMLFFIVTTFAAFIIPLWIEEAVMFSKFKKQINKK